MRFWTILHTQNAPNPLCHGCPWPFPFFHEQGTNELLLDWSSLVMIYKWLYDWNMYVWGFLTQVIMNFKKKKSPSKSSGRPGAEYVNGQFLSPNTSISRFAKQISLAKQPNLRILSKTSKWTVKLSLPEQPLRHIHLLPLPLFPCQQTPPQTCKP